MYIFCFLISSMCVDSIVHALQADKGNPVDLQWQKPESAVDSLQPEQIHISFGSNINDIVIMWATKNEDVSIVTYHTGDRTHSLEAKGETVHLTTSNAQGAQYIHRVYLEELQFGTQYYYQVRGSSLDTFSDQYSFQIPPKDPNSIHTFMVYGDMGTATKTVQFVVHEVLNQHYTAVFHIGDISYDLHRQGGKTGDRFLNMIQKMAARVPYMTCPGDHERFEAFLHYRYRFSMPSVPWPMSTNKLWYSFNLGLTHFVVYSTEVFFRDRSNMEAQKMWLTEDLHQANKRRSSQPWIVVMGHRPFYCSANTPGFDEDCSHKKSFLRSELESLFHSSGVDIVFGGHEHFYERTYPVYKSKCLAYNYKDPAGSVHITIGSFGNQYLTEVSSGPGGGWSALVITEKDKEMFGRLVVHNVTHLYWESVNAEDNGIVDKMWIIQRRHGSFNRTRQVFLPDPLANMGYGKAQSNTTLFSLDYSTSISFITLLSVICVAVVFFRKKLLYLILKVFCS